MANKVRREFLQDAARCAALLTVPGWLRTAAASDAGTAPANGRLPNIILLLADDHGCGDLGCAGHPVLQTPALDKLASQGVRFTNFYATAPVCSPARAGLLTGRIQNRFGMDHLINIDDATIPPFHHLPPQEPTLARQLRRAGYRTGHIGKWHLNFMGRPGEPTWADYGFDEAVLLAADRNTGYFSSKWTRHTGERFTTTDRWTAEVYVDEAINFIRRSADGRRSAEKPFFLNLWSFTPHAEVNCAAEYRALYAERTPAEQLYFGAITQMDAQYGRLMRFLDEEGLTDNTIVIFSSDNGAEPPILPWTSNSRGRTGRAGSKHNLGEGGLLVPGIIRWPGVVRPGMVSQVPVSSLDLLPTLSAVAQINLPNEWEFDGGDLRPALMGKPVQRSHALYWQFKAVALMEQYGKPHLMTPPLALRDGSWKLLCDFEFGRLELYNLDTDPVEQWNMAEFYPEIAQRLLKQMKQIYAEVNGPYARSADNMNARLVKAARP